MGRAQANSRLGLERTKTASLGRIGYCLEQTGCKAKRRARINHIPYGTIGAVLVTAAPCALVWPAAMIVWGTGYVASTHSHHCVQLVLALDGIVRIRPGPGHRWMMCSAALVRPDAPHEVSVPDSSILLTFVDAESALGAALMKNVDSDINAVPEGTVSTWRRYLGDPGVLTPKRVEPWIRQQVLRDGRAPKIHPAVRRVLRVAREEIIHRGDLSLERLASVAKLSPSRLMHVFTESVGVPIRPYFRWLRMQIAIGQMMGGAKIAEAADRAGFSDAAHLARTIRRLMGMTPGELIRRHADDRAGFVSL